MLLAAAAIGCSGPPDAAAPTPPQALACFGCHGPAGRSQGDIPALAGMPRDRFLARMAAFSGDTETGGVMNRIAPAYSKRELTRLADYFADLEPAP